VRSACVLVLLLGGCSASIVADGGVDGGPPGADVDVVGTWHDCDASETYRPDGTAQVVQHRSGCAREGTWAVDGDWLEVTWADAACGDGGSSLRRVTRAERGLVLVDPETGVVRQLADDATPHGLWALEGAEGATPRSSRAFVVGDPEATFGSACHWSTDGECGGHFSCSGQIRVWTIDGSRFSASTSCSGGCPCGAVIEGTVSGDTTIEATYDGVNCERTYAGTLTVTQLE